MGPTLGTNFCHRFLPSPLLGDDLSTRPMVLWIDNLKMAAVVEVVFIYTRVDLEGTPNTNTKGKGKEGKERILQQTRTILNMYKQWMQN